MTKHINMLLCLCVLSGCGSREGHERALDEMQAALKRVAPPKRPIDLQGPPRPGDLVKIASRHNAVITPFFTGQNFAERMAYGLQTLPDFSVKRVWYDKLDDGTIRGIKLPSNVIICISPFTDSGVKRSAFKVRDSDGLVGWIVTREVEWSILERDAAEVSRAERTELESPESRAILAKEKEEYNDMKAKEKTEYERRLKEALINAFVDAYYEERHAMPGAVNQAVGSYNHVYRLDTARAHPLALEALKRMKLLQSGVLPRSMPSLPKEVEAMIKDRKPKPDAEYR
jgi:hypothetical protein